MMSVDYDLLVVGGTVQGRRAAALAAREGARVALIEPPGQVDRILGAQVGLHILAQNANGGFGQPQGSTPPALETDWATRRRRIQLATELAAVPLSLSALAAMGVDAITAKGQFHRQLHGLGRTQPQLVFTTADRSLRARGYVICPPTQTTIPAIPGLADTPYRCLDDLMTWDDLPTNAIILGRSPAAIALAQTLARLGRSVTLLSRGERLLPTEDADLSLFGEQLLRAAGVTVRLGQRPMAVTYDGGFQITLDDATILQGQHLILGTAQTPATAGLNLAALGLRPHGQGIPVDDRLSTLHPRVFACGPALGGYWATATDFQDVSIAVRNALYLPYRRLTQFHRPSLLPMQPALGRVGMTATQAQRWFESEALILQINLGDTLATHLAGETTGLCRWVVHRDGRLLGAQIWGSYAQDLIQTVAGMMQNNQRIHQWDRWSALPHSHSEILEQMVAAWQRQRWQPGNRRRDWAENWFNWRRSRPHP